MSALPPVTGRPGPWLAEWLGAFLEADQEISERDLIVLDEIRKHLEEESS